MEDIYAACVTYEPSLVDFAEFVISSFQPVWILGKKYELTNDEDLQKLNKDIQSKLWFTYRKQFIPINGSTFTSDTGWGCMHRCGQMILAQSLIWRYLGRDWMWEPNCENPMYSKILNRFNDSENCKYSIHNIAVQGDILDKKIGEWFGPNTVAQVLKRLVSSDTEIDIVIHVAMDNMIVKSDIRKLCEKKVKRATNFKTSSVTENGQDSSVCDISDVKDGSDIESFSSNIGDNDIHWKPLLLIIPLRLGLDKIIAPYIDKLKAVFEFQQCVGIIGGRTNHASYFIGYVGDNFIFLDPHVTQVYSPVMKDESYHCRHPSQMKCEYLEPSVALCFYCGTKEEFETWCTRAQMVLLEPAKDALFEILEEKPKMPAFVEIDDLDDDFSIGATGYSSDRKFTSDDEFELLL